MKHFLTLAVAGLLSPLLTAASSVDVLTASNFDTIVDGSKNVLVKFYAPWCGHCKNLAPTWEELADAFVGKKSDLSIAKMDCDASENKDLCGKHGIKGFPTLKFFKKGGTTAEDYTGGGRDLESLSSFVSDKTGFKSKVKKVETAVRVLTEGEFEEVVEKSDANIFVEFYAPWCGHCKSLAPTWEKVAQIFATESKCIVANLDATVHKAPAEKYDVKGFPTLKFFKVGQKDEPIKYEGPRTEESIIDFLNEHCGTFRLPGGGLSEEAGKIAKLDELAAKYIGASESDRSDLKKQAQDIAKDYSDTPNSKYAEYYAKVMDKFATKGVEYISNESQRLGKLIESATTTPEKIDDFYYRKNILSSFKDSASSARDEL